MGKRIRLASVLPSMTGGLCKMICGMSICKSWAEYACKCSTKSKKASIKSGKFNGLMWSKREYNFSM